ncbi:unnamed protein product, partial [Meganyctiphanes norvegica]
IISTPAPHPDNGACSTSDVWRTKDSDGDGLPDYLDNCPNVANVNQADSDDDRVGDGCDTDRDVDNDGVDDEVDNCIFVVNPEQSDADHDGIGDQCDADADDDGIPNTTDNCMLVPNPAQEDANDDGLGDVCQIDEDGDCIANALDICPGNPRIKSVDFRIFYEVVFEGSPPPQFVISNGGKEITQKINSRVALLYGQHSFSGVDFSGTFFIGPNKDNDYAGFV